VTGAQDFLPDYEQVPQWHSVYSLYPKYSPLFTAMRKAKEWLHTARVRYMRLSTCILSVLVLQCI